MLRQERAIVSEVHGTTRDWLEGSVSLEGIPVRLFDTAGLRDTSDPLEVEGMRRTEQVLASADLVIYLVDSTRGMDVRTDVSFMARWSRRSHDPGVEQGRPSRHARAWKASFR